MSKLRKQSDIWNAIDSQRPKDIKIIEWKQSYLAVKAAIEYIGLSMVTTEDEFNKIPIPIDNFGFKHYLYRKIIVTRNGIQSKPTQIKGLLSGTSKLLTKVDIVWFFYGIDAINILQFFDDKKVFQPCRHVKKNRNPFTLAISDPKFRYDIGKSKTEINRLLQQKLEFAKIGIKNSIQYYNEDDSQIMCQFHRIEHKSFEMTRDACAKINVDVKKYYEDNYSCVDFRINDTKVQDKTYKHHIRIRSLGKLPYNPDMIDILQCSNLTTNEVYAIPMRYYDNNIIKSTFSPEILMKTDIKITTRIWEEKYLKYKFDFKNEKDIYSYVKTCRNAAAIPQLTDRNFFKNLIDINANQFGSEKQVKERITK